MGSVLIVENNLFFRHSLRDIIHLMMPQIVVREAADASEALRMIERVAPVLILTEIHLNGKNGLQLTREVKALHPEIFIAVLTDYDYEAYRDSAYWCGADQLILKDEISGAKIVDLIDGALSRKIEIAGKDQMWRAPESFESALAEAPGDGPPAALAIPRPFLS